MKALKQHPNGSIYLTADQQLTRVRIWELFAGQSMLYNRVMAANRDPTTRRKADDDEGAVNKFAAVTGIENGFVLFSSNGSSWLSLLDTSMSGLNK